MISPPNARSRKRDALGMVTYLPVVCSTLVEVEDDTSYFTVATLTNLSRHDITDKERKAYTSAVQCLLTSPQKLNRLPGAKTRWDELVSLHQIHALQIHTTGQFLPYHRYYLKTLEVLLRECGFKGVMP
jgi:hypothetical protein